MTHEELSRVLRAMGIQSDLLCFFYRQAGGLGAVLAVLQGYWFVTGANIITNKSTDGREERG